MIRKHNFAERLNIISQLLVGESITRICQDLNLDIKMVTLWYHRYLKYGEDGLRPLPSRRYSVKDKKRMVKLFTEKRLSLHQICLQFDVSRASLKGWAKKVREGKSLKNKKRKHPSKDMARPKKREPQTELEKLQAENLRLRAENALLKKVRTLVEEEKARARLNGQKPSMS